jgi:radical SAM protein with 4Fe4S-binding SPASM domain
MRALRFPRRINVELTNYCNQRCRLCPRQGFTRPLGFMDPPLFLRIARECARHPTALWLHFLGESLLHPEAVSMIRSAKRLGVAQVGLSTNGVSLGAQAQSLLESGLDRLECSMDALDRETYRSLRGRDHFERVVANVEAFLARKRDQGRLAPVTSIQFMRTREVERTLEEVVARWRPLLGPRDFVMTIEPAPFGGAVEVGSAAKAEARRAAARPPCRWLFESLVILQDGTVSMCGADWDARAPVGNVRESSIQAIWTGPELERRRRLHRAGRFGDAPLCGDCDDWRLADGSGYRNALEETGGAGAQRTHA